LTLTVLRSAPAIGHVLVDWVIEAINSQPPNVRFRNYNDTIYFNQVANLNMELRLIMLHGDIDSFQ